jgi:acetyl-CoA C-acetyltransferase
MGRPVIVSACRTAIAKFQGVLSPFTAPQLGSFAVIEALRRSGVPVDQIDEVLMGNVLQAGLGQNPARQVQLAAGIPNSQPAMTVNKVCGSGLKTVMLAAQAIKAGDSKCIVAGGMESMTNAPYYLPKAREGARLGHTQALDAVASAERSRMPTPLVATRRPSPRKLPAHSTKRSSTSRFRSERRTRFNSTRTMAREPIRLQQRSPSCARHSSAMVVR